MNFPRGVGIISNLNSDSGLNQNKNLSLLFRVEKSVLCLFLFASQKVSTSGLELLIRASHHSFKDERSILLSFKSQPSEPFVVPRQESQSGVWVPADNGKLIYFYALCSFSLQKMNMSLAWLTPEVNCFKSSLCYMHYVKQSWICAGPLLESMECTLQLI